MPKAHELQCLTYPTDEGHHHKFRLMERIRPSWKSLAIALKFEINIIDIIAKEDDSVYSLLTRWLRGQNMEQDKRPLTWRTLIDALDCASFQQDVKLLEECLVALKSTQEQGKQLFCLQACDY